MKSDKPLYITTTLPYVNSEPHLGFAAEIVQADVVARFNRLQGREVFLNTGTDEHGSKIHLKAIETGIPVQTYVDGYAEKFKALAPMLGIIPDVHFIRTTDENHIKAAQEFWKRVDANGYIYKKNYSTKYCIGCELEKTDSELVNGQCAIHPTYQIEHREEENYFFKFSAFGEKLLALYTERPDFVIPDFRFNEIKAFVERGLEDFSISRLAEKMSWGIPVPGDEAHVMYVWFDALVNYVAAIGWPTDMDRFEKFWPVVQFAGKDNLRQQSAMWQAMLMAAGMEPSKQIVIRGFITAAGGQKMSKSIGNVIAPQDVLNTYVSLSPFATDVLRFFLVHEVLPFEDSVITLERLAESYSANLQNGLGNLVSRSLKMSSSYLTAPVAIGERGFKSEFTKAFETYNTKGAIDIVMNLVREADAFIQKTEPFKVYKVDQEKARAIVTELIQKLSDIAFHLAPFLPDTAQEIDRLIAQNVSPEKPLFARLEN